MSDPEEDVEEEGPEYESGPFCAHWGEPGDCDEPCLREGCKHACRQHGVGECVQDGCECEGLIYEDANGERVELK